VSESTFKEKFVKARKGFKDSQEAAARKMDIATSTVRGWERGTAPSTPNKNSLYGKQAALYVGGLLNAGSP